MRFVKPLDESLLKDIALTFDNIITVEDGVREGGFGSAVTEWFTDNNYFKNIIRLGIPDTFIEHGTVAQLQHIAGIDPEAIANAIKNALKSSDMNDCL